jgi:hypothetical protein
MAPYRYALERPDYSDLASGRVLHSASGVPAFPVRLASEVFQTCLALRGGGAPVTLYDPCCGAAYLLCVLAYLHRAQIGALYASDVDERVIALAQRNLTLLTAVGLEQRRAEISSMLDLYGKESHRQALESIPRLEVLLPMPPLPVRLFQADAADPVILRTALQGARPDLIITDLPYGQHSAWGGTAHSAADLLEGLCPVLVPGCLLALATDKSQKVVHPAYKQLRRMKVGKRQVVVLKLMG